MWLTNKINLLLNNLKTDTMAKTEATLFKITPANDFREIAAEFTKLDSFIEGHKQIPEQTKNEIKRLVHGYKERSGEKTTHVMNVSLLNTAIGWTNNYIESLTK